MAAESPSRPLPLEAEPESLARYLRSFTWSGRDAAVEEMIIAGGLPLWREILSLLPEPAGGGRLLELGSLPFHITLLVQRLRRYTVTPTAGVIDERRRLVQRLHSAEYGEDHEFDCACFDLEHEPFPFADGSFDAVLLCEVIEHLAENPVFTLSEIHRVLRPGGTLLVSTPNAARVGHLMRWALGGNPFDQYHLGSPLRGSRHAREYTLAELRDLIGGCGFGLDLAVGRNLDQIRYTRRTRVLEPLFRLLARLCLGNHDDHLFVRAVKTGPFLWSYPAAIFDEGHLRNYLDARAAEVVFGVNDVPHTTGPWGPMVTIDGGVARTLAPPGGTVHLLLDRPTGAVELRFAPARGAARVACSIAVAADARPLLETIVDLAPGDAQPVEVALPAPVPAGSRLRIELRPETPVLVRGVRAAR